MSAHRSRVTVVRQAGAAGYSSTRQRATMGHANDSNALAPCMILREHRSFDRRCG
jgi:hypothetical protein